MISLKRGAIFHSIDSTIHQIVIHFCVIMATTRRRSIHLWRGGGGPLFIHFSMDFCSSLFWPLASGLFMTAFKWKLRLGGWTTKALRRDSGRARGVQVERSITLSIYPSLVAGHLVFSIDLPLFFWRLF